jgi:hypothetical protein
MAQLYSQALGSLFAASYESQDYGGGIRIRLHEEKTSLPLLLYSFVAVKHAYIRSCYLEMAVV